MKKIRWIALALVITGCSHQQHNQAQREAGSAPVSEESELTGQPPPVYPRALPVTAPPTPAESPSPTTASVVPVTTSPVPAATPGEVPLPAAMDTPPAAITPTSPSPSTSPVPSTPSRTTNAEVATATPSDATAPVPPAAPSAPDTIPVVVLQTSFGRMVLELDDFAAPKTCENFRKLVSEGFYNRTIFHRVIPHFIIQGGDPNTKTENRVLYGRGDPGYTLPPEIKLQHDRGAVAMARLPDSVNPQRNSNGSQFYICVAACPSLDNQYTVFAHVIQGMDVADRIAGVPRDNRDNPVERITLDASLEPKDQALQEGATSSAPPP